jgi:hypothetical protein
MTQDNKIRIFPSIEPRKPAKILAGDFTLMLHNGTLTRWDIKNILGQLEQGDLFGYILPKVLEINIPVAYESADLPYDEMSSDPDSQQALAVYKLYASIMVKHVNIQ